MAYSSGGTIGDVGSNLLAGFSNNRRLIDLSGLNSRGSQSAVATKTVNLTQQIFTPNQDSFRLNADQRNQDLIQSLKRGF